MVEIEIMRKLLVTGGTGFLGRGLIEVLDDFFVLAPIRKPVTFINPRIETFYFQDLFEIIKTPFFFSDVNVVIHIAALAHTSEATPSDYFLVNTKYTLELARAAALAGVKRFIFISSIGVNGVNNIRPFTYADAPLPVENYALSKLDAEIGLKLIASETGMEVVIIRPPLVYGPFAPGNFGKLIQLAKKNLPLPLGAIYNKRSLVALDNLIDLIITCIDHPKAADQIFLVSDDSDVSITELLEMLTVAAGKKPRLLPVPLSWLKLAGQLTGKQAVIDRLCGNLQVDISHTKETLGWKPPITVEEGIRRCFKESE